MNEKIKSFFNQSVRVWKLLRRPTMFEFKTVAKVSAIGLLAIGLIGFAISTLLGLFKF
ncbi:MAG: protein translocase SEC61 complex subunit gamma [Candidatus Pacearchaeota archaeon]